MPDQHYDVIVIGSGAGGGTLVHRLAPTGKRILLVERGGYLPRERANWESTDVFVNGKYRAPEFWLDRNGDEFPPEVNYYVGGNTKFYGAASFRLRPQDFGRITHHGGISPAWPIDYHDLEPYYTQAEQLYLVHGAHGEDPRGGDGEFPVPVRAGAARSQGSSSSAMIWKSRGCIRSISPSASISPRTRRATRPRPAPASAATGSTDSHA